MADEGCALHVCSTMLTTMKASQAGKMLLWFYHGLLVLSLQLRHGSREALEECFLTRSGHSPITFTLLNHALFLRQKHLALNRSATAPHLNVKNRGDKKRNSIASITHQFEEVKLRVRRRKHQSILRVELITVISLIIRGLC